MILFALSGGNDTLPASLEVTGMQLKIWSFSTLAVGWRGADLRKKPMAQKAALRQPAQTGQWLARSVDGAADAMLPDRRAFASWRKQL